LWFEPDVFDVKTRGFSKLEIETTIWGSKVNLEWNTPDVVNLITGETMSLTTHAHVTAWHAWRLRKLIDKKCHVIILTKWVDNIQTVRLLSNQSQPITPPSAPQEDNYSHSTAGNQLHVIQEMVPLSSNLYPSLALKDIQVELIQQPNTTTRLPIFDRHVHIRRTVN
jgi:hypothetical protein